MGLLYEANIDAEVKFMAKSGIVGCGWVEVPKGKAQIVEAKKHTSRFANVQIATEQNRRRSTLREIYFRCQLEAVVKICDLIVHEPEGEWSDVAPIRFFSFWIANFFFTKL